MIPAMASGHVMGSQRPVLSTATLSIAANQPLVMMTKPKLATIWREEVLRQMKNNLHRRQEVSTGASSIHATDMIHAIILDLEGLSRALFRGRATPFRRASFWPGKPEALFLISMTAAIQQVGAA